jgi:hypothetical protein
MSSSCPALLLGLLLVLPGRSGASMLPASIVGMTTSDYVSWGIFSVVSMALLVCPCRGLEPVRSPRRTAAPAADSRPRTVSEQLISTLRGRGGCC